MQILDTRRGTLEPALAHRFSQGLYLPGEGQLDNRQLLAALVHELDRLQVRLHWHTPRDPATFRPAQPARPTGYSTAAAWAPRPVAASARCAWRSGAPARTRGHLRRPTRLVHPRYPIYIAPKEDHLFVIGATEIESDDLSPASVRSTLELLSAAYTVHTRFCRGAHSGTAGAVPPHPARQPACRAPIARPAAASQRPVPPWLHDCPGHARCGAGAHGARASHSLAS